MSVRTRFAPSPTGFLHIGGARTALFNYLFARRHGGAFLLRIEDTDKARSTTAAIDAIHEGMTWLGLTPDEEIVYQSANADRHLACAHDMLANGTAFRCYVTQEALAERREKADAALARARDKDISDADRASAKAEADALRAPFRSPYRDGGEPPAADAPFTIRLRAPDEGRIALEDAVQGQLSVDASEIDDLILVRADGTPTYMLAVVVDDHDMAISHVIRGDDHLNNTYRQIPIYQALGWDLPVFAHIPMIHGHDGAKLSKRHGALGVDAYRDMGYLPEGMRNYLARLGWSHGDDELFSDAQAVEWFDLSGINRSPARLDLEKLAHVNAHHLGEADTDRILALVQAELAKDRALTDEQSARLATAMDVLKTRGNTIPEIASACAFLLTERPIDISPKALKKLKTDAPDVLVNLSDVFAGTEDWRAPILDQALAGYCADREVGMGRVGPPLRTAVTGGLTSPDLGLVLEWLGKAEVLGRIQDFLNRPSETAGQSHEQKG